MQVQVPPLPERYLDRLRLFRDDPWAFCCYCVFTNDPQDMANPKKAFPRYAYLKLYIRYWQKHRLFAVPKSRRMFISWVNVALYLHDAMFNAGRHQGFVSKKEEDADTLGERAKYILEHIPEDILPKAFIPAWKKTYCHLEFPEINSKIQSFPSGSDQLRMHGFSGLLFDEMAFWDNAPAAYSSAFPTIEAGGRMTAVSSPAPSFFKNVVYDKIEEGSRAVSETTIIEMDPARSIPRHPIPGVQTWINPKNNFLVFELHYSANPEKQRPEYISAIKASMPLAQFNQEFELAWDSFEGKPVYPDFDKNFHVSKELLLPEPGLPLLLGMDFGLTPACVICQVWGHQLVILREVTEFNMGAERFSDLVIAVIAQHYPRWRDFKRSVQTFVDPSGYFRKDTDEGTCAEILEEKHFNPQPGPVAWEGRRQSVEHFILGRTKEGPMLLINGQTCPMAIRGFAGGYQYPERSFEIEPNKIRPLKNEYSHVHDALQYVASAFMEFKGGPPVHVPTPSYGAKPPVMQI